MSFRWFRKHQKLFLWAAVVFTVVVFATFSGLGDLQTLMEGGSGRYAGEFVVQSTGEIRQVPLEEFLHARNQLNKLYYGLQGAAAEEDDVWRHIMLLADADGAGIDVSSADVILALTGGQPMTKEDYRLNTWGRMQFASARELESLYRDVLRIDRWARALVSAARIVDADDVYVRWKADNERRDFDALVFADREVEDIDDPSGETLRAWYDEQTESYRAARYKEDARFDIVLAWLPLDAGQEQVPDSLLADLPEPDEGAITARFDDVQAERWPEASQPDDAARAALVRELRLVAHVQRALAVFEARTESGGEAFAETMRAAGLNVEDSEGPLGSDELKALPVDDQLLPLWLNSKQAGDTHLGQPAAVPRFAYALYVQDVVPSRPLSFDEAHDKVLADWKERQRDQVARDFRERIRDETRKLPDVAALIAPLEEAAAKRAEEAVAADPELDETGREDVRQRILEEAEQRDIIPRLAEHEHKVWATLELPEGVERLSLAGVSRNYEPGTGDEAEPADSVERLLKTNRRLFSLAVDAISDPLRFATVGKTAIVRVAGRAFPERSEMLTDAEGFEASRKTLANQRADEARLEFTADRLKTTHQLKLPVVEEQPQR